MKERHVPVSMPNEAPMPKIRMNKTKGAKPGGGGRFRLSLMARTTMRRTAVARNSEKKHETFVI